MAQSLIKKITVAVNGTEQSFNAAMYAIMLSKQLHCKMEAVFVVDKETLSRLKLSKFLVAEEAERYESVLRSDGKKNLEYVEQLAKTKGLKIETRLLTGCVWSEIVQAACDFDSDMILIGGKIHTKTGATDFAKYDVISATYREILRNARCNVLVVCEENLEKKFKIF